jgi:HSP20 family protein
MDVKSLIPWRRNNDVSLRHTDDAFPFLSLQRGMNRLFDDFFRDFDLPLSRNGTAMAGWPMVEVNEDDQQVRIVAELPGMDQKDIDLSLRDGILTIKGEKKGETKGALYSERWQGRFSRSFDVGSEIDPDKVQASFDKGVLTVTLEKQPGAKSRTKKIEISHHH